MADEESDGLLSQEDINAALAEAGLAAEPDGEPPQVAPAAEDDAGGVSQADIDAALAAAETAEASAAASPPDDARVDAAGRPFDEVAAAMAAAIEAETAAAAEEPQATAPPPPPPGAVRLPIPELMRAPKASSETQTIDLLRDVKLDVKIELGRTRMLVDDVLRLGDGSVVELDKLAGDPVDVLVNGRLVARGEVLVLNDNFCVRINDIVSQDEQDE